MPRWFGNTHSVRRKNGTINENGVGKFSAFTPQILAEIRDLGVTHIWYTGVIEHATQTDYSQYGIRRDHPAVVKGRAGSPYAIKDYYDIDPDLADHVPDRMAEFEALVQRTHDAGMKVIIDFVPNHVARQYGSDVRPPHVHDLGQNDNISKAFDPNNNFYYLTNQPFICCTDDNFSDTAYSEYPAKATGNDCFSPSPGPSDWYETVKLNYGIDFMNGWKTYYDPPPDTWLKMRDILLFWAGKNVDGFRCDMAEMVPVEFWKWVIPQIKAAADVCFIAEIYKPDRYRDFIYRGQFDYLYDKVGLYDTLRAVITGHAPAGAITGCWQAIEDIREHILFFLENHDEQRIASDFFAGSGQAGYPGMIVAATLYTNPLLIYSGQEFSERGMDEEGFSGIDGRTSIFDYWSLDTIRNWLSRLDGGLLKDYQRELYQAYTRLLHIVASEPAISKGDFFDLMYVNYDNPHLDTNRQYVFLRKFDREVILIAANFDSSEKNIRINIPPAAFQYLHIPDNQEVICIDLFTGERKTDVLTSACPFRMTAPGHSGKLLKFIY